MKTLGEMLAAVVKDNVDRVAIVDGDRVLRYDALGNQVAELSARLYHLGIRQGDRVALFLPNGADFVISYFAAAALGAIIVPLNSGYQKTELRHFLEITAASLLLGCRELEALSKEVLSAMPKPCELVAVEDHVAAPPFPKVEVDPGSPAMYQFSSGSTGTPKRIARTHTQLLLELESLIS